MIKVHVFGNLKKEAFEKASLCAKDLRECYPETFDEPYIKWFFEIDWAAFIAEKKRVSPLIQKIPHTQELGNHYWAYDSPVLVYINSEAIGNEESFRSWAKNHYDCSDHRPMALYTALTRDKYLNELYCRDHLYVKMGITIGGQSCGSLLIELYSDLLPKTCENFRALCTGELGKVPKNCQQDYNMHYVGTLFFRLVKNGWIQGGDVMKNRGNDGCSIYGKTFKDESFAIKHDRRGIVSMANAGRHTNGSQFFITLAPTPWMDELYVAFGRVIEGSDTLESMEQVPTENERPIKDIQISECQVVHSKEVFDSLG